MNLTFLETQLFAIFANKTIKHLIPVLDLFGYQFNKKERNLSKIEVIYRYKCVEFSTVA